jgi:hypothetical protein
MSCPALAGVLMNLQTFARFTGPAIRVSLPLRVMLAAVSWRLVGNVRN